MGAPIFMAGASPRLLWFPVVVCRRRPDNVLESLFHAISLMAIFIIAWGVGIYYFLVKQKHVSTTLTSYAFWQRFCSLFQLLSGFYLNRIVFVGAFYHFTGGLCLSVRMRFFIANEIDASDFVLRNSSWNCEHCFHYSYDWFYYIFLYFLFLLGSISHN